MIQFFCDVQFAWHIRFKRHAWRIPQATDGVSKGYGIYYGANDEFKHSIYSSETIKEVVKIADERMYKEKQKQKRKNWIILFAYKGVEKFYSL